MLPIDLQDRTYFSEEMVWIGLVNAITRPPAALERSGSIQALRGRGHDAA